MLKIKSTFSGEKVKTFERLPSNLETRDAVVIMMRSTFPLSLILDSGGTFRWFWSLKISVNFSSKNQNFLKLSNDILCLPWMKFFVFKKWKSTFYPQLLRLGSHCLQVSFSSFGACFMLWKAEKCFAPPLSRLLLRWECYKFVSVRKTDLVRSTLLDRFTGSFAEIWVIFQKTWWCEAFSLTYLLGELRWDLDDFSEDMIFNEFGDQFLKYEKTFDVCEDIEVVRSTLPESWIFVFWETFR